MDTLLKLHFPPLRFSYQSLIGLAMLLMAVAPMQWLIHSWFEAALDSQGVWVFLLCVALFVWSVLSPKQVTERNNHGLALDLLLMTTLIRAVSQVFAVNVLGAIALAVDVYALSLLCGLGQRKNALSPAWLAVLFVFCLPIERILQRLLGFALQHISADGACFVLQTGFENVQCLGVRILLAGQDVLVDLPCSGVKSLSLLLMSYVVLMAVFRPQAKVSALLAVLCLLSAVFANVFRISVLSVLLAYPEYVGGVNVMIQPYHDVLGLLCLALAGLPLWVYANIGQRTAPNLSGFKNLKGLNLNHPIAAFGFFILALVIIFLPRHAIDVADKQTSLTLPAYLNGKYGQAVALTEQEQSYFTQFGGAAVKMRYGDSRVLWLRTTSPLRHLHSPDECLRGLGFDVQYLAVRYDPLPTVSYLATAKDGSQWRVAVTFYSAQYVTSNVSEVVWRWFQHPASAWYAVQRITPIYFPEQSAREFDHALFSALDLEHGHVYSH